MKNKGKIISAMRKAGELGKDEFPTYDRIQMYIKGVSVKGKPKTIIGQLQYYEDIIRHSGQSHEQREAKKIIKKLQSIPENPNKREQGDYKLKAGGNIEMVTRLINKMPTSRKHAVRLHLEQNKTITAREAFMFYDIMRLSDQIYTLRKEGLNIGTEEFKVMDMYGEETTRHKYFLVKQQR